LLTFYENVVSEELVDGLGVVELHEQVLVLDILGRDHVKRKQLKAMTVKANVQPKVVLELEQLILE
jgi:hypothetical protein